MKKIRDFVHEFKGFGNCHSECDVTIWESETMNVVLFTDRGVGTSVTNFSEGLATQMKPIVTRPVIRFFEKYDDNENPDEIFYTELNGRFVSPEWKPFTADQFETLINQ